MLHYTTTSTALTCWSASPTSALEPIQPATPHPPAGATLYMEPAPCVPLNNAEALLEQKEEAEVALVLSLLSRMVRGQGCVCVRVPRLCTQ